MCVCIYGERLWARQKEIDVKKLAHVIVEASRSKICRVGWLAGNSDSGV